MSRTLNLIVGVILILLVGTVVYSQFSNRQALMQAPGQSQQASDTGQLQDTSANASDSNEKESGDAAEVEDGGGTVTKSNPSGPTGSTKSGTYTLADVAKHSGETSCWSAINGNVYDLTSWIPQHPGGPEAILSICGKDGSDKFNQQHGGIQRQAMILAGFKIGVLK